MNESHKDNVLDLDELILDEPKIGELEGRTGHIYKLITALIRRQQVRVFSVYGKWGSGKTSICRNCYEHFRLGKKEDKDEDTYILPVWFDAWRYQHEREIYSALLKTIGGELLKIKDSVDSTKAAKSLLKSAYMIGRSVIAGFKAKTPFVEYSAKDTLDELRAQQKHDKDNIVKDTLSEIADFGTTPYFDAYEILKRIPNTIKINKKNIRILIFIDDLDRCLPDVAFNLIEQLKIWFDINGYTICLALEKDQINKVVTKHLLDHLHFEKDEDAIHIAKNYLLKVIPIGIYIDKNYFDKTHKKILNNELMTKLNKLNDKSPYEVLSFLEDEGKFKEDKDVYTYRKRINSANEIYIEHKLREIEEIEKEKKEKNA